MHYVLVSHPASPAPAIAIAVEVTRTAPHTLALAYHVTGATDEILLPAMASPDRADELWRHTCFEAFLGTGDESYVEWNLSPSGQWAAYRFDAYRSGMREAEAAPPGITMQSPPGHFELWATLALPADAGEPLALSAVIEVRDGSLSYWALAHPPGRPDFHHRDCFAGELPAAGQP